MDGTSARERGTLTPGERPTSDRGTDDRAAWRAGREDLREALGPLVRTLVEGGDSAGLLEILREKPGRRRLARARLASGEGCFFKHYPPRGDSRGLRGRWKSAIGLAPATREFRALQRLHAAGIGVPEPIALYRFPDGAFVLVMRLIEGRPLRAALALPHRERRSLLVAVGALVARLHAAGFCHRDLHAENVWVTPDGPILIDLPAALPSSIRWLRRRDLGELDASVAAWLSLADRLRLRVAGLGATRPLSRTDERELRAVGRASDARRRAHLRSRTRRSLRTGRLYTPMRCSGGRGMRLRELDEAALRDALETQRGEGLRVQRFARNGTRVRAGWRGSAAKRAWLAGHGLIARGIGAARPRAFLEWRRFGLVERSALVFESPRVAQPSDFGGLDGWLRALVDLAASLRRDGVDHEELATAALCMGARGELGLTGLEAIRFPRRLDSDACLRIDAFVSAQLEASGAPTDERDAALRSYRARTRFLPGPVARISGPRS